MSGVRLGQTHDRARCVGPIFIGMGVGVAAVSPKGDHQALRDPPRDSHWLDMWAALAIRC